MRAFVYEYASAELARTAGVLASIVIEGRAMQAALVEDFSQIPGAEVLTLGPPGDRERFCQLAGQADWTIVVAPEFDSLLLTRCRWVEEVGGRLLGPSQDAIRLTADKLLLARHLLTHGVPTPTCYEVDSHGRTDFKSVPQEKNSLPFPGVWKPRLGAGSQATFLARSLEEMEHCNRVLSTDGWSGEMVWQEYVPGQAASVAFLCGPNRTIPLLPALQRLSTDGRLRYLGGEVPLLDPLAKRAVRLALKAVNTVNGLLGFVGVDLVLGDRPDGSRDYVIEINPRLTTSYVGLRVLARSNLADAMLWLVQSEADLEILWRPGTAQFQADGTVTTHR